MATLHVVKQGECLSSIARQYGLKEWRKIYDHPDNANLRQRRPNPHLLSPGDRIHVPEREERVEAATDNQRHRFRLKTLPVHFRIRLTNRWGQPFSQSRYQLDLGSSVLEGSTDDDGRIERSIPPEAEQVTLSLWLGSGDGETDGPPSYCWRLRLGYLDPVEELSGIQGRLRNLGYDPGPIDGVLGPKTARALFLFQIEDQIPATGQVSRATT